MAGRARLWLASAALLPLAWGVATADHVDCPPFERLRYDYTVEFHHGGDLFSEVRMVGFTDFRFCYELRDRVLEETIRWEARGGAYELRIVGEESDEIWTLRGDVNQTRWYDHAEIRLIQAVGLSHDAQPTLIPGESPPAASLRAALPTLAGR